MAADNPSHGKYWIRVALRALAAGAITAAIAASVAHFVSQAIPKAYDSQAGVLVGSLTATTTDELDTYQRLALTYADLATTPSLLNRVIERLGLPDDSSGLASRLDIRASGQGILRIDATAPTPSEAAEIANAVADEILRVARPTTGSAPSLASVFQPADPPREPSSPRPFLNALIAAVLGFALGGGLAVLVRPREPAPEIGGWGTASEQPEWPIRRS